MWEIIRANQRKSAYLVVLMAGLLFALGYVMGELFFSRYRALGTFVSTAAGNQPVVPETQGVPGGLIGLAIAFIIWLILTVVAYFQGRQVFISISGAQKIRKSDHPQLYNVVEEMVIASQLGKMPDIYIIDDPAPNAFATGRNPETAAIAVTSGLLNRLNRDELQGVIGHEIGHVKNRDILFMTMIGVMMGSIVMLSDIALRSMFFGGHRRRSRTSGGGGQADAIILILGIVLMVLAPVLAQLIYFAASRKREYLADASSAQFTRFPEGLARALEKISHTPIKGKHVNRVTAPMYIVNPLQKSSLSSMTSTHPPVEQRVKILRSMAGGADYLSYDKAYRQITASKQSVLPASALKEKPAPPVSPIKIAPPGLSGAAAAVAGAAAFQAAEMDPGQKVRQTTDALWKAKNYRFINCSCGARLKVPPAYRRNSVTCLRCKKKHPLEPVIIKRK